MGGIVQWPLYSLQWDFWLGAVTPSHRSVYIPVHEDGESSGNTAKNSSAKSIILAAMGFLARRRDDEPPECTQQYMRMASLAATPPKIQVRRVYLVETLALQ